jgi:hypothetical protein
MLEGAGFFCYIYAGALLQRRVSTIVSSQNIVCTLSCLLFTCNVLASALYKMNTFSSDRMKLMFGNEESEIGLHGLCDLMLTLPVTKCHIAGGIQVL